MSATNILIQVGATTASAIRELDKVNSSLDTQGKTAEGMGGKMSKAGALAATGALAAAAGVAVAAKAMWDMGLAAVEDQQSVDKMNESLGKIPGVTAGAIAANEDWVDSMQIATLFADTSLRQSVTDLALATGSLTKAQELTALAADLATTKNISLEAATKVLTKGTAGSTGKLEDWGLVVDKNKDGTIDYTEMVDGLSDSIGGASEAAADTKPWERIGIIWGELQEAMGAYLIPLFEKLGEWFKDKENQQKVKDFIDKVAELSRQMGENAVKAIEQFILWLKSPEGKKAIADFKEALSQLVDMLKSVKKWLDDNDAAINTLKGAFKIMGAWVSTVSGYWSGLIEILKTVWSWIKKVIDIIGGIRVPSWLSNLNPFSMSAASYSTGYGPSVSALGASSAGSYSTTTYKVYVTGTGNAYNDAKIIKRALEHEDSKQGRQPGQRLAMSW